MRKVASGLCLAAVGWLVAGSEVLACGDKPLVLGQHVRSQRAKGAVRRASILVLLDERGQLQTALREMRFERDLVLAGHIVRVVSASDDLVEQVRSGEHDILVASLADVAALEAEVLAGPDSPTLLPLVVNATGDEWAEAQARFTCIKRSPSAGKHYLAVIEEVMVQRQAQKRSRPRP